jgi:hypothetical protein
MNSKSPDTLEADQQEISNIVMFCYDSGDRSTWSIRSMNGIVIFLDIHVRSSIEPYPRPYKGDTLSKWDKVR